MNFRIVFNVLLFMSLFSTATYAQDEAPASPPTAAADDFSALSLEDLMKIEVALPSKKKQSQQNAAAIVSIVTRADIELYGMRDLSDVLRLVPGFEFGMDSFANVGLGSRGLWVHEGKALIMINGVMANDLGYGNVNFLSTFPAAIIEKVEIIRGPGSAVYGGLAEANVINVITRSGKDLDGVVVNANMGSMGGELTKSGNLAYGKKTEDMEYSLHFGKSMRPFSSKKWSDFYGGSIDLDTANSGRYWQHLITEMKFKDNLTIRYNQFSLDFGSQSGYGAVVPPLNGMYTERLNVVNQGLDIQYTIPVNSKISLIPTLTYMEGVPMGAATHPNIQLDPAVQEFNGPGNTIKNYKAELKANYDHEDSQLSIGAGYAMDWAESISTNGDPGLHTSPTENKFEVGNESNYAFAQWLQTMGKFNLTAGGRYEDTVFGDAFAPRVGVTYTDGDFNSKLLYGQSYRVPLTFQAYTRLSATDPNALNPESSETWEYELGYLLQKNLSAKLNIFYLKVKDVITYVGAQNLYANQGEMISEGVEGEVQYRLPNVGGFFNFSYVQPRSESSSAYITADKEHLLGLPNLKLNLGAYYIWNDFQFGPSLTYLSTRYGQTEVSANSGNTDFSYRSFDAIILTNLSINWREVAKDIDLRFTVHNIFDEDYLLVQPYYGGHAPMPAYEREFMLNLEARL
ncbi:MAG: TonB-dependent receptor plug domain-containing protein [Bdellovibrionota bacterium]